MQLDSKIPEGTLPAKWTNYKFARKLVNPATPRLSFSRLSSPIAPSWWHVEIMTCTSSGSARTSTSDRPTPCAQSM